MLAKRKALHECMPITDGSAPASSNCLVTSHLNVCEDKYTAVLPSVFCGEKTNEHPRTTIIFEVNKHLDYFTIATIYLCILEPWHCEK